MALHHRTHPVYVEDCLPCKWVTVKVAPSIASSTAGGAHAARSAAMEKQWDRDGEAYVRLRRDGLQPADLDGAAAWEKSDASKFEIEAGRRFPGLTDSKITEAAEVTAALTPAIDPIPAAA